MSTFFSEDNSALVVEDDGPFGESAETLRFTDDVGIGEVFEVIATLVELAVVGCWSRSAVVVAVIDCWWIRDVAVAVVGCWWNSGVVVGGVDGEQLMLPPLGW